MAEVKESSILIQDVETKNIMTKSSLPVGGYSVNPYVGCGHGCKYCYASFMKRFTNHPEPWGEFIDVKFWPEIKHPERYAGKELFLCYVTLTSLKHSPMRGYPGRSNTLDEDFRADMDNAVSIERRLAAMKAFHDAGVRTTCFISPIFPGLTDLPSIIHRAKNQCNLVWLENLNLRGGYKKTIFDYITEKHPDLLPLYDTIYNKKERSYWSMLDAQMRQFCQEEGLLYVRDNDSIKRPFNDPPIVVNYFFNEEIIPRPKCRRTGNQNYIVTCRKLEVVEVRL